MINELIKSDIDEVNQLGFLVNPNFKNLFQIDNLKTNEKIYVLKVKKEIIGFIHFSNNIDNCELLNISVKNDYRSKGAGYLLINYFISNIDKKIKQIFLEVNENNKAAINLYLAFDFRVINIRKNYYKNENALVMERVVNE